MLTKEQLSRIRELLQAYEIACDNILYKHGNYTDDSRSCMELEAVVAEAIRMRTNEVG